MKIKTGDTVIVLSGDDKGKIGKVLKAMPKENKVLVEGVNAAKKHVKPSQANPQGTVKDINLPIDASNVAVVDPKTNKATRIGYKTVDGKKVRIAKKSGTEIK
ncbi:MAG: 50S ribosomal protein L24 [Eubacteriales bacterium]|nr:50S ribosomal protein L24 [Eubacteriales bacterium]